MKLTLEDVYEMDDEELEILRDRLQRRINFLIGRAESTSLSDAEREASYVRVSDFLNEVESLLEV